MTATTTRNNTWAGCKRGLACFADWETDGEDEARPDKSLVSAKMIFEDPAYECERPVRGCGNEAKRVVWTSYKSKHEEKITDSALPQGF